MFELKFILISLKLLMSANCHSIVNRIRACRLTFEYS